MATEMKIVPDYDHSADVLYLTLGEQFGASECEDTEDGITIRYSSEDMRPIGVIVVGYDMYGWHNKAALLAERVGSILHVPPKKIRNALSKLN